jgi:hypothetical protein
LGTGQPVPSAEKNLMELNQLKRQLKDLGERIASLRGFL